MINKVGKDAWKYQAIYNKTGVLAKPEFSGSFEEWQGSGKVAKWTKYGHSMEGRENIHEILDMQPKSLIDIGCGWNEFCKTISRNLGIKCFGVDIACPGADYVSPAHHMPKVKSKEFDLLTSFDCIEHIPELEVQDSFAEFARVAHRVYLKICLEDSHTKINNEGLHVCLKEPKWWAEKAEQFFTDVSISVRGTARFDTVAGHLIRKYPGEKERHMIMSGICK